MKIAVLLLALVLISGCSDYAKKEGPYRVTRVIDGDTIVIGMQHIRLAGINTPEVGECYAQEAAKRLDELTKDRDVYLERDRTDIDKYNRPLRYVYADGVLVDEVLVEGGYAKVFDKYKDDIKMYDQLKMLEEKARSDRIGVWACNNTVKLHSAKKK